MSLLKTDAVVRKTGGLCRGSWIGLFLCTLCGSTALPSADPSHRSRIEPIVVAAYFAEWGIYNNGYTVADIPASRLTHIIYSFAAIENGEIALVDRHAALEAPLENDTTGQWPTGNLAQLAHLKTLHPHLKTLIAVGGWTLSGAFSDMALTKASRQRFARSAVAFIRQYGFDGMDLDWEYPVEGGRPGNTTRPEDRANYALLTDELRRQLDTAGAADDKEYVLTVASPAGARPIENFDLAAMARSVDWFNLMAYDYSGTWETTTGHLAPLRAPQGMPSVSDTLERYRNAGVPNDRIVLGIPLYARAWSGVPAANNGLHQQAEAPLEGLEGLAEPGYINYSKLQQWIRQKPGDYTHHFDSEAQAAYIFNPTLSGGTFFTLETPATMKEKLKIVHSLNLRGVMFWSIEGDVPDPSDPDSLIGVLPLQ